MRGGSRAGARRVLVGLAAGALVVAWAGPAGASVPAARQPITRPTASDWPTYGHDAQHTFHGRTTLTETSAAQLQTAWFFPTGDAVTATPTVVAGVVYVGSWDDTFYAVRAGDRAPALEVRAVPAGRRDALPR